MRKTSSSNSETRREDQRLHAGTTGGNQLPVGRIACPNVRVIALRNLAMCERRVLRIASTQKKPWTRWRLFNRRYRRITQDQALPVHRPYRGEVTKTFFSASTAHKHWSA